MAMALRLGDGRVARGLLLPTAQPEIFPAGFLCLSLERQAPRKPHESYGIHPRCARERETMSFE